MTKTCVPIFFGFMLQPCIAKHLSPAQTGRGANTAEEGGLMKCPPLLSSFRNNKVDEILTFSYRSKNVASTALSKLDNT